jgi:hypothetical protein
MRVSSLCMRENILPLVIYLTMQQVIILQWLTDYTIQIQLVANETPELTTERMSLKLKQKLERLFSYYNLFRCTLEK